MQNQQPIALESQKFTDKDKLLSTYDKEMLALMHAIGKFKQYFEGQHFIIDHQCFKYSLSQKNLSKQQTEWMRKLQGFDFEILDNKEVLSKLCDCKLLIPPSKTKSNIYSGTMVEKTNIG